jgi:hypothetical protein
MTTDSDFAKLDFDVSALPDRRKTDEEIVALMRAMFVEIRGMRQELHGHIQDESMVLKHAFPNGDPDGHRAAHDAWIRKAESQAKFWQELKSSVFSWGALGVLGFLAIAAWKYALEGPK